jgi:hypothetical protein|tara:strand:+ start:1421 stop:1819 length:399 start_codon:yes stop_codon:yes gene_type:complete
MTSLSFGYEEWDNEKDLLLREIGNETAYGAVNSGTGFGRRAERREAERDPQTSDLLDGMFGLLAGTIEWLRWYGYSASEVQSRVAAKKCNNMLRADQASRLAAIRSIGRISDTQELVRRLPDPVKRQMGIRD